MAKVTQMADFLGQTINVGMDVHLKSWNITLYNGQQYLRKFQQEANPETLLKHLGENYPGAHFRVAYEAGFCGFWIQRALERAGIECIVVNAADVPQTDKGLRRKNDVTDSYRIGEALSCGMLKPIFVPDRQTESDRTVIRYRHKLHGDLVRSKTRIKSFLNNFGIKLPAQFENSKWTQALLKWLRELEFSHVSMRLTLSRMIGQVEQLQQQLLELSRDIRAILRHENYLKNANLLMSVPGIGALTAITILTEIGSIHRFPTFYKLNSFIGLCPTEFSSGDNERKGFITPRHHMHLRRLLVEMAWTAIRLDPAINLVYLDYKKRMTAKRAIIRIARKMLHRIYYVLLKEQPYVTGIIS
jgi:transposase